MIDRDEVWISFATACQFCLHGIMRARTRGDWKPYFDAPFGHVKPSMGLHQGDVRRTLWSECNRRIQSDDIETSQEATWIIGQDAAVPHVVEPGEDAVVIIFLDDSFLQALKHIFFLAIMDFHVYSKQTDEWVRLRLSLSIDWQPMT